MRSLPALLLAACACAVPLVPLQAESTPPPVDPAAVLAALKDLKAKQAQTVARGRGQVLDSVRAALADPAKAYEQAVIAVEIQGKGGNEGAKLADWRKQNGDQLRDKNFVNALRLQLSYITLSLQRSAGAKNKDLIPALYDYTAQVVPVYDTLWTMGFANKGLGDNVFVNYFQIGPYLNGLPDWESQPFNVDGIFQKSILPVLREQKDPRLLAYWDNKLKTEASRLDAKANGIAIDKFNNVRRPALLWGRAEDELLLGDRDRAVADMLGIIKTHPDHPDFDKWVAKLTEVVTPKAEVIVRDAPGSSPAPAATK